jgi:two-component system, sensor histidine kinase and response regulator
MDRVQRGNSTPGSLRAAFMSGLERMFASAPPAAPSHAPASAVPDRPTPQALQVLVVDDNPSCQGDACELLALWGITPMLAADGAEAVALACAHEFDLILMDLQMPVLDGLAATTQIRRFEREQSSVRAPVVAYTSAALSDSILRNCGVDDVLEKPCDAQALQACLLRWCPGQQGLQDSRFSNA